MTYELSHDTIAKQVFEKASTEARTRRKVEKYIRERYEAYEGRDAKLTQDDVDYILPYLDMVNISSQEAAFIEKGRKGLRAARRRRRMLVAGAIAILLAFSIISFGLWRNAENQKKIAVTQKKNALRSDSIAKEEAKNAILERDNARREQLRAQRSDSIARKQEAIAREQEGIAKAQEKIARREKKNAQEQAREADAQRKEAQSLLYASESDRALAAGNRIEAFDLARKSWELGKGKVSRDAVHALYQTAMPIATLIGDKVSHAPGVDVIVTTRAIYSPDGTKLMEHSARHVTFSKDGKYVLLVYHGPTKGPSRGDNSSLYDEFELGYRYEVRDGQTADLLHAFSPANPVPSNADQSNQCRPIYSTNGKYSLHAKDLVEPAIFYMDWVMTTLSSGKEVVFQGHYENNAVGEVTIQRSPGIMPVLGPDQTYLYGFHDVIQEEINNPQPINGEEIEYKTQFVTSDWKDSRLASFAFDAELDYSYPTSLGITLMDCDGGSRIEYYSGFNFEAIAVYNSPLKRGFQFFPRSETMIIWDEQSGPQLWRLDDLRMANWLFGDFKKMNIDGEYIVTQQDSFLYVWDWDARLVMSHKAKDIFIAPDPQHYVLERYWDEIAFHYKDKWNFLDYQKISLTRKEPAPGQNKFEFKEFRPDDAGVEYIWFTNIYGQSSGGPAVYRFETTQLHLNWAGELISHQEISNWDPHNIGVPTVQRAGEAYETAAALPSKQLNACLSNNRVHVWSGLAGKNANPCATLSAGTLDSHYTYDLGASGHHVAISPDGTRLLAVTDKGKAKIWKIDPGFSPDAYIEKYEGKLLSRRDESIR